MRKLFTIVCLFFTLAKGFGYEDLTSDLPAPYNELEELLPFHEHGFYINSAPMKELIHELDAKIIIELGSWIGESTRDFARMLPDDGIVYAVDHWLGSADHTILPPADFPEIYELLPKLYEQFLSNVIHENLTDKIVPIRQTTLEAATIFLQKCIRPDIVYVDASHDEESVYNDLVAYYPLVKNHGVLCGDDWGWGSDLPVMSAVKRFARENNLKVELGSNNWMWILKEKNRSR